MQFSKFDCKDIFLDDLKVKTGDIILFKGFNNYYSMFHGSYFGHIGIVYVKNSIPMIFEANGIEYTPLLEHHSKKGVYLTPLKERIAKYKGKCFLKELNKKLSDEQLYNFDKFIDFALNNMYYNHAVISSGAKKGFGLEKCNLGTNCSEIVFLSLISLNLLPIEYYDMKIFHHLRLVCNLDKLQNDYYYKEIIGIIDHPFAY